MARVDGARVRGHTVVGREMPVSFTRAHPPILARIAAHRPVLTLGFGVAVTRSTVTVEQQARRRVGSREDVDALTGAAPRGPRVLPVLLDPARLAAALDAQLSQDAGDYVCNSWLYQMLRGAGDQPVGFVHLPLEGLAPEALLTGLDRYLSGP